MFNIEGQKMNTPKEKKIPAFFKVFIPELCSQRMQIPSAFTCCMKGKLTDCASFLRNCRGNVWAVDVTREGRELYLEKGWVRFVEDNNVKVGDFLVFQFSGDNFFDFKHFGRSCCQKETVGSFIFTVKPEKLGEENEEAEKHNNLWTDEEDNGYDDEEDEVEEAEEYDDEEGEEQEDDDEDNDDYEEEEEEKEGIAFETSSSRVKKAGTSTNRNKGKAVWKHEAGSRNKVNRKRVDDIFKSGLNVQPENAHFVACLGQRKANYLFIPNKLIEKHRLNIPEKITIIGEDGKGFASKIHTWAGGRTVASDGWRAFCRWNFLKKDERCICEFVTHKELMVRIFHFHEGKWMPRPRI